MDSGRSSCSVSERISATGTNQQARTGKRKAFLCSRTESTCNPLDISLFEVDEFGSELGAAIVEEVGILLAPPTPFCRTVPSFQV